MCSVQWSDRARRYDRGDLALCVSKAPAMNGLPGATAGHKKSNGLLLARMNALHYILQVYPRCILTTRRAGLETQIGWRLFSRTITLNGKEVMVSTKTVLKCQEH